MKNQQQQPQVHEEQAFLDSECLRLEAELAAVEAEFVQAPQELIEVQIRSLLLEMEF